MALKAGRKGLKDTLVDAFGNLKEIAVKPFLDSKTDNSVIAPVEDGTTASRAYVKGQHFIKDGAFCTAIANIVKNATLVLNTNYIAGDVSTALIASNKIAILTGNAATETGSAKLFDYPSGFTKDNSVVFGLSVKTSSIWREMGIMVTNVVLSVELSDKINVTTRSSSVSNAEFKLLIYRVD